MFSKNQLISKSNYQILKETFYDSISKKILKNEFNFQDKYKMLRKFYFIKRNTKAEQMKLQLINKTLLNQEEKSNRFNNNILTRNSKFSKKINHQKKINKYSKCKIQGGGCRQSGFQIKNPQKITLGQKKRMLDKQFLQNHEHFIDKKNITDNIECEKQRAMQMDIINFLKASKIHIRQDILLYKPKLIQLIDVYLMYVLTGQSVKEVLNQNEIRELRQSTEDIKSSFEIESQDIPSLDLIFFFDILVKINSIRLGGKGDLNQDIYTKSAIFIQNIVKKNEENVNKYIIELEKLVEQNLKNSQTKESQTSHIFLYLVNIWVKKYNKFKGRIQDLKYLEELKFYIEIFNDLCRENGQPDHILLTLIKIDYYLSLVLEDKANLKTTSENLSLNSKYIQEFIKMLIEKSNSTNAFDQIKSFLKFTVQNHTYRFLTISILLKYNEVIQDKNDFQGYQEKIMVYISYKYLCEKTKSVQHAFSTNIQFVEKFNSNILSEQFQKQIIKLSNERREDFKIIDQESVLEGYEEKIDNIEDIERMIANILIDKWEKDIKKRQQDDIAQKDDVLLEVKDLYIQQQITYLQGNNIIQERQFSKPSQNQINEGNQPTEKQNALQEIMDRFLLGNNIYAQENKNINISSTERQNRCKILGILAEGGTGKSMFIKKLETCLIQNPTPEKENYIPILIKCNSLDSKEPSIEKYLLEHEVTQQQINNMKKSDRNKVILLDGYDEYTGEYFKVYQDLNLDNWKNTKVIVTSRKEKLELSDACAKFCIYDKNGFKDEDSFCIVKLEEFTHKDIIEYCKMYFRQYRTKNEKFDETQYQNDMNVIMDCMSNRSLESLLYLPINLYLFTRMIVQIDNSEIQKIKENISDQIGIQDFFFNEQFKREAHDFILACKKESIKNLIQLIINSFFEYFQLISVLMFLNKGKKEIINFLQIRKDKIEFKLSKQLENIFSEKELKGLHDKIYHYVNSKIITRSKKENSNNQANYLQDKNYLIEFKHKSLFEYFVARAMKYDFNVHENNIHKLTIEQLKEFNINKRSIMIAGQNQSEQWILIKLYKMIQKEIESDDFYSTYHLQQIEQNSRYIQYVKKSTINKNIETSQIDIGASNMLSALFLSKFTYSKLKLNLCSFSKLYVSSSKIDSINFKTCNLQNSYVKNLPIDYDSCNIQYATFDAYQKVFDTSNIFSFNQVIWGENNILYTITESGFINSFKLENQNILLQKSKQLSQTPLNQIVAFNNNAILVSSQFTLLLIDSNSFDLQESYKFNNDICSFTLVKENILVTLKNKTIFQGSFQNGFQKINIIGSGCIYNKQNQNLLVYQEGDFSLYNIETNFELIKTIESQSEISSVAYSIDGKYLVTGSTDSTFQIWNAQKDFGLINTIQNHYGAIISVIFSADGKYLATSSADKTCKIWNVEEDFEIIKTIKGHIQEICSVAFSGDGNYLATCSSDKTCKIWNAEIGFEIINTIQGHTNSIWSVAFSGDGKYLATGSADSTCKIWNAEKGFELINSIQGHTNSIWSVVFSADGKYLATGSSDETCKIWNAEKDFELIKTLDDHTNDIWSVIFSEDGQYLATGSLDKTCKIWNPQKDFELIKTLEGHTHFIRSVAFTGDGKYLATGSADQTCKIWNVMQNFDLINTIQGHTSWIYSVAFSGDGKYLATSSADKTCKIWSVEKDFELYNTIQEHSNQVKTVTFSADGRYLATGSDDKTCKIWNAEKGFELINTILGNTDDIYSVAFSVDGKYLATGSKDNTYKIWNSEKGFELINSIQGHINEICSVAFSSDRKYLATGSRDYTCKIWNVVQGFELINTIQGHSNQIRSVAFSGDGKYLATGSADYTCKIWNVQKGFELMKKEIKHSDVIYSVAFSVEGKYLATGSADKTCKILNVEKDFELIALISDHTLAIFSVAFSGDGKYLVTGSADDTYKIWNVEKGFEFNNTIQDHNDWIYSVAFSGDGKYLATGSEDNTCRIWNAQKDFELIKTIQDHTLAVYSVAFSEDGKYLATGSMDKTCKIWNVEKGFELINTIQDHTNEIRSVAFYGGGKYLATGSRDNTCKIWNIEKGFKIINTIQGHADQVSSVAFSEDSNYICIEQSGTSYNIYDSSNLKIVHEQVQNNFEQLQEIYQFDFNKNNQFKQMKIFENMFIL